MITGVISTLVGVVLVDLKTLGIWVVVDKMWTEEGSLCLRHFVYYLITNFEWENSGLVQMRISTKFRKLQLLLAENLDHNI